VIIGGVEYGKGAFLNKKISKQMAAEETLDMLCPGLFPTEKGKKIEEQEKERKNREREKYQDKDRDYSDRKRKRDEEDNSRRYPPKTTTFAIDDEEVLNLEGQSKTPAQVLQEYCTRYHKDLDFQTEVLDEDTEERKFKTIGKVGEKIGEGYGKNKREAKQHAAQSLLKQIYPDVKSWNQLLVTYSHKFRDENSDRPTGPNFRLLEKLKEEMKKLLKEDPNNKPTLTSPTSTSPTSTNNTTVACTRNNLEGTWEERDRILSKKQKLE